jgi:signal recognition particle receptor subunit alpha
MLDYFCIFTKGGVLLWAMSFTALKGDPVNALIRTCLLEDRGGESSFGYNPPSGGGYAVKWHLHNGLGLVFVAVYQRALKLLYVDELLERVTKSFAPKYSPDCFSYPEFDASFQRLLRECEAKADASRRPTTVAQTGDKLQGTDGNGTLKQLPPPGSEKDDDSTDGLVAAAAAAQDHASAASGNVQIKPQQREDVEAENEMGDSSPSAQDERAHGAFNASLLNKKLNKRGGGPSAKAAKKLDSAKPAPKKPTKPAGKQARRWDDLAMGGTGDDSPEQLDFTEGTPAAFNELAADMLQRSLVDVDEDVVFEDEDGEDIGNSEGAAGSKGLLSSFVRSMGVNVMGTGALTRDDIAPALAEMKKKLMERNVAEEISEKISESVAASLEGQRLGSFTRVSSAVQSAVEEALTRILTPKRSIDVLREVRESRGRGKPYVIVFVGVNGVGKSTNLAKVAYWLVQNGAKVMIAACDTFRSGAVEQLKTHCARLSVPLYERGYEKDPAKVAFEAAKAAQREGRDVLLVDTAGRMQDNEPLMRALSNLINVNQPDLVLFVGEALVGNDAVDQLTKFNRRLADLAAGPQQHLIDGIVLTKFDTIDEKVGAALSMVYTSGAPIMFVGCGQTYVDLKRLNVKSVVKSLLK